MAEEFVRKIAEPDSHKLATVDTLKSRRAQLEDMAKNHPDGTVRMGARLLLQQPGPRQASLGVVMPGVARKASPLIDQTQSQVRMPGAPAAAPMDQQGGRSIGDQQDVAPASSVSDTHHRHMHSHNDETGSYQHEHPHDHPVRHNASDEMDSDLHDHHSPANKTARLERMAKQALDHPDPLVRQGGRELSKVAAAAIAKARTTSPVGLSPELRQIIQEAVTKAVTKALGKNLL
jgi:hypothetical protein